MRSSAISRVASGVLVGFALLLSGQAANAATYKLAIRNGETILKIFVDNGTVRRVGYADGAVLYEVEMPDGKCSSQIRLVFTDATNLDTGYDVCSETGFGLTKVYR